MHSAWRPADHQVVQERRTVARFQELPVGAAHYESFFLRAVRPDGRQGVWIRYTVDKAPGASPQGAVWCTWFEAGAAPVRLREQVAAHPVAPTDGYVRIGEASFRPGHVTGSVDVEAGQAAWDLSFVDRAPPFHHYPHGLMYRAPLPRTKLLSPHPSCRATGRLMIDGRGIDVDDWRGMVGHNWGAEHAERWIWIQAIDLDGDGFLDLAAAQVRIAGRTTPWLTYGALVVGGRFYRIGGLSAIPSTRIDSGPASCSFSIGTRALRLTGHVGSEPGAFATWDYSDPDGGSHAVRNCSIADLELTIGGNDQGRHMTASGTAVYELGERVRRGTGKPSR